MHIFLCGVCHDRYIKILFCYSNVYRPYLYYGGHESFYRYIIYVTVYIDMIYYNTVVFSNMFNY